MRLTKLIKWEHTRATTSDLLFSFWNNSTNSNYKREQLRCIGTRWPPSTAQVDLRSNNKAYNAPACKVNVNFQHSCWIRRPRQRHPLRYGYSDDWCGHLHYSCRYYFDCTMCAETAILELAVKLLTSSLDSATQIVLRTPIFLQWTSF